MWRTFTTYYFQKLKAPLRQQNTVISNLNILSNSNEVNEINTQLRNFDRITDEIQAIQPSVMNTLKTGNDLVDNQHYAKNEIKDKITQLQNDWHDLEYKLSLTKQQLDDTKNIETIKSDCQNLNNKVNNNISKLNNLNFKNPELANSLTKFNNLKINYNQINDEVDNIEHKKLPKLKEQVKLCDSEAANFELNNLESSIYNYSNLAKDKNEDLNHIDLLSKDLTNCNALQEWCDDKRVVLGQIQIPDQLDQVDLVKRRVDGWENEIEQYQPTIQEIKNLPAKYHTQPESQEIVNNKVNNVIASWEDLVISINNLKEKLKAKQSTLEFALNCDEIINSCQEKMRLADAIVKNSSGDGQESPSKDLDINSVMNVQKKLASLERDRDALVNRVKELEDQAKLLAKVHPERANEINKKVAAMKEALDKLNEGIKEKQAGLGAAGALFSFIHELDDLEQWVKQSLQAIEDAVDPTTLSHVAELQNTHDALKAEIDSYDVSINRVCKTGRDLVKGRPDEEAINQRLDNLANDFEILKAKANERSTKLDNFNIELKFNAEAKQIETILDNKNTLMKNQLANLPQFVQESEQAVRNQEALVSALDGTRIRVEALDSDAAIATIPAQPNMQNRANEVTKKFEDIKNFADQTLLDLQHNVKYAKFNVDCAYFADWLTERKALLKTHDDATEAGSSYNPTESNQTSGVSANDGMEIHIAFQKHSAFMQELQANHDKLKKLHSDGKNLKELIPNKQSEIDDKLDNLQFAWDKLTQDCQDREKKLFEYRRAELLDKNIAELDNFANSINGKFDPSKPLSESDLGDLATVNRLLKDHELDKTALDFRKQELDATENRLADDLTGDELADMQNKVEALRQKFKDLDGPMNEKYQKLMEAKLYHQLKRDLTEELRWVDEKTALASSNNFGESLHAVQVLEAKHDTLINEVKQHEPVITDLLKRSIPNKEVEEQALLKENWEQLQNQFQDRSERLKLSGNAQNYLFDNEEANEWIYERAQMILAQEKQFLENEHSANRMIRKHNQNMEAINDYESKINNLAGVCRDIENNNNPDKVSCSERQADLETSFANLKNLANTRQDKLNKLFNKLKFKQELEEFNNWLSDKQRLADNSDTGKDTHHSERLLNKFDDWSNETNKLVDDKHQGCQESGHQLKNNDLDSTADVDNWLSNTETHVADLKNSIDNRKALLNAAFNKNKCLDDMNDITNQLNNKKLEIPKENGDDAERTRQLLKQHDTLSNEAKLLLDKAQEIDNNAVDMLNKYIDPNDQNIHNQVNLARNNLKDASDNLQTYLIERTRILKQVADTHDFNNIAGDLLEWIEETNKKIDGQQRPSDKTQVHSLMQEHANIKNELESRQPEFEQIYEDVAEIERNLGCGRFKVF